MKKPIVLLCTAAFFFGGGLTSCGGGGGNGFVGAAEVTISASPSDIDTGDRTLVEVNIDEIHENGIALKVRYPTGLTYVTNSAFQLYDGDAFDIGPKVNATSNQYAYLVFYISEAQIESGRNGTVRFQLEGASSVSDGEIEVDPDVDDPDISNETEFNIENPEFDSEDSTGIHVRG